MEENLPRDASGQPVVKFRVTLGATLVFVVTMFVVWALGWYSYNVDDGGAARGGVVVSPEARPAAPEAARLADATPAPGAG